MPIRNFLCAVLLSLIPAAVLAHPLYLTGTIGKAPVLVMIEQNGDDLSGWYFYFSQAKLISLTGKTDAQGHFQLEEMLGSRKTGAFEGNVSQKQWIGVWRSENSKSSLPLSLSENRDTLDSLSVQFDCSLKKIEKSAGPTYHNIDLRIVKGRVTQFTHARGVRLNGDDEQSCSIDLSSLKQAPSDAGILLKSTDEDATSQNNGHCTLRIVGDGKHLYVQMGDWSEKDDDCRSAGDTMYCSPRAWWGDLVIDQTTKACKSVE